MERLNDLIDNMVSEAPTTFTDISLNYIKELATIYAKECAEATVNKVARVAKLDYEYSPSQDKFIPVGIDKESIKEVEPVLL